MDYHAMLDDKDERIHALEKDIERLELTVDTVSKLYDEMLVIARQAIEAEREACARVVEGYPFKRLHSEADQAELAAAIRARKGE